MPLIYAFVAVTKGPTKTILAEYTAYSGNFSTIATQVLLLLLLLLLLQISHRQRTLVGNEGLTKCKYSLFTQT